MAQKVAPFVNGIKQLTIAAGPHATKLAGLAQQGWKALEPYHPEDLIPSMFGIILCFFGGAFVTTISNSAPALHAP